jgi:hypothetical protein
MLVSTGPEKNQTLIDPDHNFKQGHDRDENFSSRV